jgi:hypothetical protein
MSLPVWGDCRRREVAQDADALAVVRRQGRYRQMRLHKVERRNLNARNRRRSKNGMDTESELRLSALPARKEQ